MIRSSGKSIRPLRPADVFKPRNLLVALMKDAMADSTPLLELVRSYVDPTMLEAIARESSKGRLLLVATTNLDALQPVVWDIGAIAESRHPDALSLIHNILIASTSIP